MSATNRPRNFHPARSGAQDPELQRAAMAHRRANFRRRCELLLAGLDNSENTAELVFRGMSFSEIVPIALRDPTVWRVFTQVPFDYWTSRGRTR